MNYTYCIENSTPPNLRRPKSLQHHLEKLYRGHQFAKQNSKKKLYTEKKGTPLQVKHTKS
jgi:hypothetical protein